MEAIIAQPDTVPPLVSSLGGNEQLCIQAFRLRFKALYKGMSIFWYKTDVDNTAPAFENYGQ